ncbi:hypothetical protein evm_012104, partial [Chilo suppressalis]
EKWCRDQDLDWKEDCWSGIEIGQTLNNCTGLSPIIGLVRGSFGEAVRDASQAAYGACAYIRSVDQNGRVWVKLLCAKSRVAPLKSTTIPRLELCDALLAAELSAKRVMGYILRFINNCQKSQVKITSSYLTTEELQNSIDALVKLAQSESFGKEIQALKKKQFLDPKSKILSLNPFLDEVGMIRVGGSIDNSKFSYDKKHPMLLDVKHRLSVLIFEHEHRRLMHAGPQLLLAAVREQFWVTNGRNLARSIPHKCGICKRFRAKTLQPLMGNLPNQRLTPGIPFETTGVDFAGPFYITDRKGRGCKISKCYLCIFVCFATKALHLEANELDRLILHNKNDLTRIGSDEGIKFHFSPAYAPNFGGLWEAGVKSAKFHLKRILGDRHLTFEELTTLFAQIESILNSRPICPMSSNPSDLCPLTPGHFLIGRPMTALPSPQLIDAKISRLDRYNQLEQMRQHYWSRWHNEYIAELQHRIKWKQQYYSLKQGDLVIIKEDNLPPLKWRMGRIQALFPGKDGIPRVADICTSNGVIRRALSRLCPLHFDESSTEELKNSSSTGEDVRA